MVNENDQPLVVDAYEVVEVVENCMRLWKSCEKLYEIMENGGKFDLSRQEPKRVANS